VKYRPKGGKSAKMRETYDANAKYKCDAKKCDAMSFDQKCECDAKTFSHYHPWAMDTDLKESLDEFKRYLGVEGYVVTPFLASTVDPGDQFELQSKTKRRGQFKAIHQLSIWLFDMTKSTKN
jgi:hypothetical protein